jgi:hypothetical protein
MVIQARVKKCVGNKMFKFFKLTVLYIKKLKKKKLFSDILILNIKFFKNNYKI